LPSFSPSSDRYKGPLAQTGWAVRRKIPDGLRGFPPR
jgi:hypothetical protein